MAGRGLLKYHIVGTLWVGQSSIVYRATDVRNQIVAIKMLLPETAAQRSAVRMMQREAELSLSFDHPNIIQAIESSARARLPRSSWSTSTPTT